MSVHASSGKNEQAKAQKPVTSLDILSSKGKRKIAAITAYDYSSAVLVDAAGVDVTLVGDSLGMVMLGLDDTMAVTLDDMVTYTRSVVRGTSRALVVVDMPFMTYETGNRDALANARRLCVESGARAVKLEGGRTIAPQIRALVDAGIPVMGHIGLTPQRAAVFGGFKVQGKTAEAAANLLRDALAVQKAGCFSVVIEAVPAALAAKITERLAIPTIGIGAGAGCDGQVLVYHDLLGLYGRFVPKFVKQYAKLGPTVEEAVAAYAAEVRDGSFPGPENCFAMPEEEVARLDGLFDDILGEER